MQLVSDTVISTRSDNGVPRVKRVAWAQAHSRAHRPWRRPRLAVPLPRAGHTDSRVRPAATPRVA